SKSTLFQKSLFSLYLNIPFFDENGNFFDYITIVAGIEPGYYHKLFILVCQISHGLQQQQIRVILVQYTLHEDELNGCYHTALECELTIQTYGLLRKLVYISHGQFPYYDIQTLNRSLRSLVNLYVL